jgi:hypothetical protein
MKLINQLKHLYITDLLRINNTNISQTIQFQGLKKRRKKMILNNYF